jgi:hypothetical protein
MDDAITAQSPSGHALWDGGHQKGRSGMESLRKEY